MGETDDVELLKQQLEDKINELAGANAQIGKLRKTTLKQLSAISSISKPLFELDREYFGGKYQDREDGSNPFQEIQLAVDIVSAAREHLSGQSAMMDTPHLREQLGNLDEVVGSLRDAALQLERTGLEAVGLPADGNAFTARSFPEDDPVSFIVDTAGFARELQLVCERTIGRIQALVSMVQDADQVRGIAEDQLEEFRTNPEVLAETARREAEALQSELNDMRMVIAQLQEQNGGGQTSYQRQKSEHALEVAQLELGRNQDERAEDIAEVRSLAGDICMLAGEMGRGADSEKVKSARDALKEVLAASDSDIGTLASHAESVFLNLAESLQQQIENLRSKLEASGAAAESSAEQEALLKQAQAEAQQAQAELQQVRDEQSLLQQQIEARGESASELEEHLQSARAALQEQEQTAQAAQSEVERLKASLAEAEDQRREVKNNYNELEAKQTALEDTIRELKLQLSEAEQKSAQLEEALQAEQERSRQATRGVEDAQQDAEKLKKTYQEAQDDAQRKVKLLEERITAAEAERDRAQQEIQQARRVSEDSQRKVDDLANEKDDAERAARAHKMQTAELEKQISDLKDKLSEQEQLLSDQQAATEEAAKARDNLKHDNDRLQKELEDANQRAATSTAEASRTQTAASTEVEKLKEQLEAQATGRRNREAEFHNEKIALENKIDEMRKAHDLLDERYQEVEREYKSLQRRVEIEKNDRATRDESASDRILTMQAEVDKFRNERAQQELLVSEAQDLKKRAEKEIADSQAEMDKMRSARDAMQRQMDESHRQLQAAEEKMKQLLAQHKEDQAAWEQERIQAEQQRQDLAIENSNLEKSLSKAQEQHQHVAQEFERQSDTMGKMKVEFDDAMVKMRHRDDEIESLNRRIERMQKDMSSITASRDALADEIAKIGGNDEEQKRQIANLERQLRDREGMHQTQVTELKELLAKARDQIVAAKRDLEEHDDRDREIIKSLLDKLRSQSSDEGALEAGTQGS